MITISGQKSYAKSMLDNFKLTKVLVFTSDSIPQCQKYIEAVEEIVEDFEDEARFFLIKDEDAQNQSLFQQYDIKSVPTSIILNSDLNSLFTMVNNSPADLIDKIENCDKILTGNLELENSRYNKIYTRKMKESKFVLFRFLSVNNKELSEADDFLKQNNLPRLYLKVSDFENSNTVTALAHLSNKLNSNYNSFAEKTPIGSFKETVFYTADEIKAYFNDKKEVMESIKETEQKKFDSLEKNTNIILFTNSDADIEGSSHKQQSEILEAMKTKKILFSFVDVNNQSYMANCLAERLGSAELTFPILKIKQQYHNLEQITEIMKNGWETAIDKNLIIDSVDDRIKYLLNSAKVIIFIKGTPEFPRCGFTRKLIDFLSSKGVKYSYYNIFADSELRARLKDYSNWQTYPQVYVDGELVGGNEILLELEENGDFDDVFGLPHN